MSRPHSIWSLRRDMKDYVRSDGADLIEIHISGDPMSPLVVDRGTARLLAKRLDQCLDGTTLRKRRPRKQSRTEPVPRTGLGWPS